MEEDPLHYRSEKSQRGPLSENWLDEYWAAVEGKTQPTADGKALMCAYKLCRVEFRYWGMQTKLEKFIHDVGKYRRKAEKLSSLSRNQLKIITWLLGAPLKRTYIILGCISISRTAGGRPR